MSVQGRPTRIERLGSSTGSGSGELMIVVLREKAVQTMRRVVSWKSRKDWWGSLNSMECAGVGPKATRVAMNRTRQCGREQEHVSVSEKQRKEADRRTCWPWKGPPTVRNIVKSAAARES